MENQQPNTTDPSTQTGSSVVQPAQSAGAQPNIAVVNGVAARLTPIVELSAETSQRHASKKVYVVGFVLRLTGLVGTAYVVALTISAGVFFFPVILAYSAILLPSLLAVAVGHYLAQNWKP